MTEAYRTPFQCPVGTDHVGISEPGRGGQADAIARCPLKGRCLLFGATNGIGEQAVQLEPPYGPTSRPRTARRVAGNINRECEGEANRP